MLHYFHWISVAIYHHSYAVISFQRKKNYFFPASFMWPPCLGAGHLILKPCYIDFISILIKTLVLLGLSSLLYLNSSIPVCTLGTFKAVLLAVSWCSSMAHLFSTLGLQWNLCYLTKRAKIRVCLCPSVTRMESAEKKLFLWFISKEQKAFCKCIRGKSFIENRSSQCKLDFKHWQIQ